MPFTTDSPRQPARVRVRSWWLGLFLSVLVHVLAIVLVHLQEPVPVARSPVIPLPLEISIVQPVNDAPLGGGAALGPRAPIPPRARRTKEGGQRPQAVPEPAGRLGAENADVDAEARTVGAPTAPSGSGVDRGRPDLSLSVLSEDAVRRLIGPAAEAEMPAKRPHRFAVDELRIASERQEDAVANVERGRVDPVVYEYLRGARIRFERDARRLADSIQMGVSDTLRSWHRGYVQRVDGVNRGSTIDERGSSSDRGGAIPRGQGVAPVDLAAAYDETVRQASSGAEERKAEVCLELAPGKAPAATLRRESGNAALDHLAIDAFTRSIAARPVPSDLRSGIACYEVGISAFRMPPVPTVSCGIDSGNVRCVWPFKKVTAVTGRLLSVDYQGNKAGVTGRSLLRSPR